MRFGVGLDSREQSEEGVSNDLRTANRVKRTYLEKLIYRSDHNRSRVNGAPGSSPYSQKLASLQTATSLLRIHLTLRLHLWKGIAGGQTKVRNKVDRPKKEENRIKETF
jgi:hypothetical protein